MIISRQAGGFSLIEVLVGMTVGLVVLLVIAQVFTVSEGYKRTTTSGSDAQINGFQALRLIEADIRTAGYGFYNRGANMCQNLVTRYNGTTTTRPAIAVRIVDNQANNSDSIEVLYGTSASGAGVTQMTTDRLTPQATIGVTNVVGFNTCDFVIYANAKGTKDCSLQQVTGITAPATLSTASAGSLYNPAPNTSGFFPSGGYVVTPGSLVNNDVVINLGNLVVSRRFSIAQPATNGEYFLRQTKLNANSTADACNNIDASPNLDRISGVVNLQAQYGVAPTAAGGQTVNCWTSARTTDTGCAISSGSWANPLPADVQRIKAVRFAVVTRSALVERPPTAGGTCTTTQAAPALGWDSGATVDLSNIANWQCYRYRTYQTVVPLINIIWANN